MSLEQIQRAARQFDDPALYVVKPGVGLFDAHDEEEFIPERDAQGNVVMGEDGKPKGRKVVHKFTKETLDKIAEHSNARDRRGDFCPLTIGHTIRDPKVSEKEQPEPVGVVRNWRTEWDAPHQCWMLKADLYIKADRYDEALTYPRTSVELWPSQLEIDPVAIIRRTPKRDTGSWPYARSGESYSSFHARFDPHTRSNVTVLRYSREEPFMAEMPAGTEPHEEHHAPDEHEMAREYSRDCAAMIHGMTKHPYHAPLVAKYALDEPPAEPAEEEAPVGEPDASPAEKAEEEPPVQHAAFPSATNVATPASPGKAKPEKEPMQNARTAKPAATPSQFAHDLQAQQFGRFVETVNANMAAMQKAITELSGKLESRDRDSAQAVHYTRCEKAVSDLAFVHGRRVDDADALLERLKAIAPDKLDDEVAYYARILPGDLTLHSHINGMLPVANGPAPANGFKEPAEAGDNPSSPRRASQILAYQRDHNLWGEEGYAQAVKDCPKNYREARAPLGDSPLARN